MLQKLGSSHLKHSGPRVVAHDKQLPALLYSAIAHCLRPKPSIKAIEAANVRRDPKSATNENSLAGVLRFLRTAIATDCYGLVCTWLAT